MAIADAGFVTPASVQILEEPLKVRVKRILRGRFPQATVELYKTSMPRLCGNVYWEGFESVSMSERHRTHTPFENTFIEQPEEGQTE